jgi:hypothetical protein
MEHQGKNPTLYVIKIVTIQVLKNNDLAHFSYFKAKKMKEKLSFFVFFI